MTDRTVVVAVGGNALIQRGQQGTIDEQFANARATAEAVADLVADGWRVALTHGSGPQVGFILRRSEMVPADVAPKLSLDMCDADAQGGIGYILQNALGNALRDRGLDRSVAAVITQVEVDPHDPGFGCPTKPVGHAYDDTAVERLRDEGWWLVHEAGRGWRRVVPSPRPVAVVEADVIRALVAQGVVTICAGGGGIPVVRDAAGALRRVQAVVDKDLASALVARTIGATRLVIATQVGQVALDYGTPAARPLSRLSAAEAEAHLRAGQFPPGSMGPKIEAALAFLRDGGAEALITDCDHLAAALRGAGGTRLVP